MGFSLLLFWPFSTSLMLNTLDSVKNPLHTAICFKMRSKSIFQLNCYGRIGVCPIHLGEMTLSGPVLYSQFPILDPPIPSSVNTVSSAAILLSINVFTGVKCARGAWYIVMVLSCSIVCRHNLMWDIDSYSWKVCTSGGITWSWLQGVHSRSRIAL